MKVLLLPDSRGWAFDNKVRDIIKYNPPTSGITYTVQYRVEITKVDTRDWDYVMTFNWSDPLVPHDCGNLIKGCFSARWVQMKRTPAQVGAELSTCRGIVFATEYLRDEIAPHLKTKYTIIPDATDPAVFYPGGHAKPETFTALFSGNRTDPSKRLDVIREVCKTAGVPLREIQDVAREDLREAYCQHDVLINFSIQEGGPTVLLEAAMCGTPMIMPRGVGLSDKIPCFKVADRDDLLATLTRLKSDRDACQAMGARARDVAVSEFASPEMAEMYAQFFASL